MADWSSSNRQSGKDEGKDLTKHENEEEDDDEEVINLDHASGNTKSPLLCVARSAGDAAAGALLGSFVGLGSGVMKRKGFKVSLTDAGSCVKTFAVMSGIHSLVGSVLKIIRQKDDSINAGIAGCCTGLALSFPGTPPVLLQSCLTFGAFSSILQLLNKPQTAVAHPLLVSKGCSHDVTSPVHSPASTST